MKQGFINIFLQQYFFCLFSRNNIAWNGDDKSTRSRVANVAVSGTDSTDETI